MLICPCCNLHIREPTYDMEGAKCPKCGWLIYKKNERIDIMAKIILTDLEKAHIDMYIDFITTNDDPCTECCLKSSCCGCWRKKEYDDEIKSFDIEKLFLNKAVKEYAEAYIKLKKCYKELANITIDIHNLEKTIDEFKSSIDIGLDIDAVTSFYCESCKMHFTVPNDKCKIAFDGEGRIEANIHKYYICPKCTKICLGK